MTDGIRVYPKDATAAGLCMAGSRAWAAANKLDFDKFRVEGIPIEQLRELDCPLGNRACEAAEARALKEATDGQ